MTARAFRDWCVVFFGVVGILCGFPEPLAWGAVLFGFALKLYDGLRGTNVVIFIGRRRQ